MSGKTNQKASLENNWNYFTGQHLDRLVRHQVESYNNCSNLINATIQMFNPVSIKSEHNKDEETGLYIETIATFENYQIYGPQIHENNGATN